MLSRKVSTLAVTLTSAALVVGLAIADDKSKTHQAMEKVNKNDVLIRKNTKTAANFTKKKKDVVTAAEELVKLGKDVRDETEPAKNSKLPQDKWTGYMDDFIKKADDFVKTVSKSDVTQAEAKTAYKTVQASCSACHKDFRKEDE